MEIYLLSDELCAFMGLPSGSRRSEACVIAHWVWFVNRLGAAAFELREVRALFSGNFQAGYRKHFLCRVGTCAINF